jgi:hypothetical protein
MPIFLFVREPREVAAAKSNHGGLRIPKAVAVAICNFLNRAPRPLTVVVYHHIARDQTRREDRRFDLPEELCSSHDRVRDGPAFYDILSL